MHQKKKKIRKSHDHPPRTHYAGYKRSLSIVESMGIFHSALSMSHLNQVCEGFGRPRRSASEVDKSRSGCESTVRLRRCESDNESLDIFLDGSMASRVSKIQCQAITWEACPDHVSRV